MSRWSNMWPRPAKKKMRFELDQAQGYILEENIDSHTILMNGYQYRNRYYVRLTPAPTDGYDRKDELTHREESFSHVLNDNKRLLNEDLFLKVMNHFHDFFVSIRDDLDTASQENADGYAGPFYTLSVGITLYRPSWDNYIGDTKVIGGIYSNDIALHLDLQTHYAFSVEYLEKSLCINRVVKQLKDLHTTVYHTLV